MLACASSELILLTSTLHKPPQVLSEGILNVSHGTITIDPVLCVGVQSVCV